MLAWLLAVVFGDGKVDSPGKKLTIALIVVTILVAIACAIIPAAMGK